MFKKKILIFFCIKYHFTFGTCTHAAVALHFHTQGVTVMVSEDRFFLELRYDTTAHSSDIFQASIILKIVICILLVEYMRIGRI